MPETPKEQPLPPGEVESPLPSALPLEIPEEPAPPTSGGWVEGCLQFVRETLETLLLALVLYLALNLVTARVAVQGLSMYPTFKGGEAVLVYRWAYRWHPPQRGDIVIFHPRRFPGEEYIKRVVGLPGEEVVIRDGAVYINGQRLEEPYIAEPPRYQGRWVVPEGHIFVLGDNRNHSQDSHVFGPVALDQVVGKAVFVYWPPGAWGKIETPVFAFQALGSQGETR